MKKILAGVAALSATLVLAACSGGTSGGSDAAGGGGLAAGAGGGTPPVVSTSAPATTSTPAPTTSTPVPSPTSTTAKPKPTTPKPKPTPKAEPASDSGVPCAAAAAASGTAACVDLSGHKAWILEAGKVVYGPVPMLPGRKGYATPAGTFHVIGKEKLHLSKQFDNAPMPNSVFFYPGDAFHTGSLKTYSHGCIHLSAAASAKFFSTLSMGDVVQVVP